MSRKQLMVALLSLLVCAPPHANARTTAAAPNQGEASNDVNDETAGREFELFRGAEISLWRALAIATRLRAGSRVADISFDGASGSPVYRVKTLQGNRVWKDAIDARTGQVVGNATASFLHALDSEERSNLIALRAVRQELADAVLVAEKTTSGRAMGCSLVNEGGKLKFAVLVLAGDDLKLVILEPPSARSRRARPRRSDL